MIGMTAQQAAMSRRNSLPTGSVTIISNATEGQPDGLHGFTFVVDEHTNLVITENPSGV
jgi:hypothetical protein